MQSVTIDFARPQAYLPLFDEAAAITALKESVVDRTGKKHGARKVVAEMLGQPDTYISERITLHESITPLLAERAEVDFEKVRAMGIRKLRPVWGLEDFDSRAILLSQLLHGRVPSWAEESTKDEDR